MYPPWQMSMLLTVPVYITNVSGNIAPIISRIECRRLFISKMRLNGCPHPGDADLS